ncbi:Plasmodium vivax Vir protein, putative [Plasmodium ovale]|uniref:Plasmodium vivax Vir protein, putative n=1 Tax=Plasmodium ovale TaxID=36330 RepID=A0A1C3KKM4_PLAOA|nr:Plasmodium vivax Vir protein, putative [Plasmodium ovale]
MDSYLSTCSLEKFIGRLDNDNDLNGFFPEVNLKSLGESQREIIKKVASMLYRNYNTINVYEVNLKKFCCDYLNYWLDVQKNKYVKKELGIDDDMWKIIEELWLKLETTATPFQCKRNTDQKSLDQKKNRMNLMVYCVNRDELKGYCYDSGIISQNYCSALNKYIVNNYELLVNNKQCLKYEDMIEEYQFDFSEKCTLYDIPNTFPDYRVQGETFSEKPSSKNPLPYCEGTPKITQLFEKSEESDPEPLREESSSPNSAPWKSIIPVGLTFFGIFFSFIFLYKHTSLGSLLRSFMIKREKLNRYIDEENEKGFLVNSSDYIDNNSVNNQYNFSYHPS